MTIGRRLPLLLVGLGFLSACVDADDPGVPPDTPDAEPTASQVVAVSAVAAPVAGALVQTLGGNLTAAIADSGAVGAMQFCNVQAMPLTEEVRREQRLEVKRTSWRVRNPSNAPDELERAALAHFASVAGAGGAPEPWVQAVPEGGWRYYQPLPTGDLCLTCHGSAEQLGEGVPEALARLYPEDRAVGFTAGELRGLLRVSVPDSAIPSGG